MLVPYFLYNLVNQMMNYMQNFVMLYYQYYVMKHNLHHYEQVYVDWGVNRRELQIWSLQMFRFSSKTVLEDCNTMLSIISTILSQLVLLIKLGISKFEAHLSGSDLRFSLTLNIFFSMHKQLVSFVLLLVKIFQ